MSGIPNVAVNCFINSVLQLIYSSNKIEKTFDKEVYVNFFSAYTSNTIRKSHIINVILHYYNLNKDFQRFTQGDCHEVLTVFLDDIQNKDLFKLQFIQTIKKQGEDDSITKIDENIISIPFSTSLQNSIDDYFKDEELDTCVKTLSCDNLPEFLFIQLKRFKLNSNYEVIKISDKIDIESETIVYNNKEYNLRGFIVHTGVYSSGHYVCISKIMDVWYLFDDQNVTKLNENINELSKHGYIYLFCRSDINSEQQDINHIFELLSKTRENEEIELIDDELIEKIE